MSEYTQLNRSVMQPAVKPRGGPPSAQHLASVAEIEPFRNDIKEQQILLSLLLDLAGHCRQHPSISTVRKYLHGS
jgi:hypothetical protein